MEEVRYENLNQLARSIWSWCEERGIWIFTSYISSKNNSEADFESRRLEVETEYVLSEIVFGKVTRCFGTPDIDLFATRVNAKYKRYIS